MNLSCFGVRFAAGQRNLRSMLSMLLLSMLSIAVGCDRLIVEDSPLSAEKDVADPATPEESVAKADGESLGDQSDGAKQIPMVRLEPGKKVELEIPDPDLEPLTPAPEKLGIGDANPGLQIAKWVKGDAVELPLEDKVYVVEFWATWCGPCRVGMPHISHLQAEYEDQVTFIGVTRENEATVTKFLDKDSPDGTTWDQVIGYRLAIDDRGWTNTAYMQAAGQNGIPCAFVVGRDGVVEWIGHPSGIDEPLKKIVEGSWDRETAIAEYKRAEALKKVSRELGRLAGAQEWDQVIELLDKLEAETGKSNSLSKYRLQILVSAGRGPEASEVRAELVEDAWDDATTLNEIAWKTVTARDATDLDLALKAAERASQLKNDEDAMVLDTLARCYYELGQLDQAIKFQQAAVDHNNGNQTIDATLKQYQAEKAKPETPKPETPGVSDQ